MAGSRARKYCIACPFCYLGEKESVQYSSLEDRKEQVIEDWAFAARTVEMLFMQEEFRF